MDGYTIDNLMTYLQAVRGETRIKTAEESIRKAFLQAAVQEIFAKYDWEFNRRVDTVEKDDDGYYALPKDFSVFSTFTATGGAKTYSRDDVTITTVRNKMVFYGPTEPELTLTYFIKAPDLLTDTGTKVYFPQPMLIADRAYVRLKTAYFPDQTSEAEEKSSEVNLRILYSRSQPVKPFKHFSWS